MIVRVIEKKRRLVHVNCHPKIQSLNQQMDFLKCIPNESKETMKDAIPSSIQHIDKGGIKVVCTFHCHPLSHKLNTYSQDM